MVDVVFGWDLGLAVLLMVEETNGKLDEKERCKQDAQNLMIRIELTGLSESR